MGHACEKFNSLSEANSIEDTAYEAALHECFKNTSIITTYTGIAASVLCVVALLTTWALLPRWRTLKVYTSLNEIVAGTLALFFVDPIVGARRLLRSLYYISYGNAYIDLLSLSFYWSLCTTAVAYFRLVRKHTGRWSHEKKIATAFAVSLCVLIRTVSILSATRYKDYKMSIPVMAASGALITNFVIYIILCVKISCWNEVSSRLGLVSLIGVGLLCQVPALFIIFTRKFAREVFLYHDDTLFVVLQVLCNLRVVPPTVVMLFNRATREHWKEYLQQRERRAAAAHGMPLRVYNGLPPGHLSAAERRLASSSGVLSTTAHASEGGFCMNLVPDLPSIKL